MFNKLVFKNLKLKKLSTSLAVIASLLIIQAPIASNAIAAEKKEKRPTQLATPRVGKKVQASYEKFSKDDIKGALEILLDINASKKYDKAYVAHFTAVMYATLGDHEKETIKFLKIALKPDILNEAEQGQGMRLLGDMQMQTQDYKGAVDSYNAWIKFTGKNDGNIYNNIANAYYSLKQLKSVIPAADKAISAFGNKPNENSYILKITALYELKRYKDAVKELEIVIQLFPKNKTWWTQLSMFYLLIEDYKKGTQTLDLAYKLGHLDKESHITTLASLFIQSEAPYKAAILLEKHIASGDVKRDEKNLLSLANAWHSSQHIDKAAKYYGELAKMTSDPKHFRKQGMLFKQDEQFSKAITSLNKALELGVENKGNIYMSIAESYFYLEKYKKAYAAIQKAIKDPKASKYARGWKNFIVDTAKRKKVNI